MTAGFDALAVLARIRAEMACEASPVRSLSGISEGEGGDAASPWPAGVDWHLTRDAARLSGLVAAGATWRWCPAGGLDVVKPNGLLWCLSPNLCRRLYAARLLPDAVSRVAQPFPTCPNGDPGDGLEEEKAKWRT